MRHSRWVALLVLAPVWAEPGLEVREIPSPKPTAVPRLQRAQHRPLTPQQATELLARLPSLPAAPRKQVRSALQQPAPLAEAAESFPAPTERPILPPEALKVVAQSPVGEVELARQIAVTFNRPVDSAAPLAIRILPPVPGQWRWLSDQTLVFEPAQAFPMATHYQVEVAGTNWSFATPPPLLKDHWPSGKQVSTKPILFLEFNQRVDPSEVLKASKLDDVPLKIASLEELAAEPALKSRTSQAREGCWVALTPRTQLSKSTSYQFQLAPGFTSKEGSIPTQTPLGFELETHSELKVVDRQQGPGEYGGGGWFKISLNNELEPSSFRPELVEVTPPLEDRKITLRKRHIYISGHPIRNQLYQVQLSSELRDRFGQQLGIVPPQKWVGEGEPEDFALDGGSVQIVPDGHLSFTSLNHRRLKIKAYSVTAADWKDGEHPFWQPVPDPGRLVWEHELDLDGKLDQRRHYSLDLSPAFRKGPTIVVTLTPDSDSKAAENVYIQRSQLGVNTASDGKTLQVWVTKLADGSPVEGAQVKAGKQTAVTDELGVATFKNDPSRIEISWRGESLFVPASGLTYNDRFSEYGAAQALKPDFTAYMADDRHIYRPGDSIQIKGWLRRRSPREEKPLGLPGLQTIHYQLDQWDKPLARGQTRLSPSGGFHFQVKVPDKVHLGELVVRLPRDQGGDDIAYHTVEVQEYRRPEFEVGVASEPSDVILGGRGAAVAAANYFDGGNLANAKVKWTVSSDSVDFQPPGWEDYTFESWRPWWENNSWWQPYLYENEPKSFQGQTDPRGRCRLDLEFPGMDEPRPRRVEVEATVSDASRQSISGRTHFLVHPASCYVGLKAESTFAKAGEPLKYQVVVTDLRGKALPGKRVELALQRLDWVESAEGSQTVKKPAAARQVTSGSEPVSVEFHQHQGGLYQLEASVKDEAEHSNHSDITSWVEGQSSQPPPTRNEKQSLALIPKKRKYQPGNVAEILIQPRFSSGYALATISRVGLSRHQLVRVAGGSGLLKIPIVEGDIPNAKVTVQAVGKDTLANPVEAEGELNLEVSTESNHLGVSVSVKNPRAQPGQTNQVEVQVRDPGGRPVAGAEVTLLGVDEAILSLSEAVFQDPLEYFYRKRGDVVLFSGMRDWIALHPSLEPVQLPGAYVDSPEDYERYVVGGAGGTVQFVPKGIRGHTQASTPTVVSLRGKPAALAFYEPQLQTDNEGRIHFPFRMTDTLTRFRVVALAAARESLFGKGESSLQSRQSLSIRPSPPRFLNRGDRCQLPLVVQNLGDLPAQVKLVIRSDRLDLQGPAGMLLDVPAGESREALFPVLARSTGIAHVQALAMDSAGREDATAFEIPVPEPVSTDHFASYCVLDEGARSHPVRIPKGASADQGVLEFCASSTALTELFEADSYLRDYPYGCNEQLASKILGELAAGPVHKAFGHGSGLEGLKSDLLRLQKLQNSDGGWDFWERSESSVPIVGLHVSHALLRAKQAGWTVDPKVLENSLAYVTAIRDGLFPESIPRAERRALRSYAMYILERSGRPQSGNARDFIQAAGGIEQIPLEGLGWLLPSLAKDPLLEPILNYLEKHAEETASSVHFGNLYQDDGQIVLSSAERADCLLLDALVHVRPEHRLVPKLVRGLLDARRDGCWENTQANCFALLALSHYFAQFESKEPDFRANVWLDTRRLAQQAFVGRTLQAQKFEVPTSALQPASTVVVQKQGEGRLYYRLGLSCVSEATKLKSQSTGLTVERTYEGLERAEDVVRDSDGNVHIKAGSTVKVNLRLIVPGPRYHVALSDPLPAGLEVLNPELKTTASLKKGREWWYEHDDLRDQKVDVFTRSLRGGVYSYSYYAQATTIGHYQVAPAHAEEMYHPETSGRSSGLTVMVE